MAQRYLCITPSLGVNLYDTYTDSTTLTAGQISGAGPTKMKQLGVAPGTKVRGNLNTEWLFVTIGTAATGLTAGTAVNVDASTFQANTGTGGISGKPLMNMTAGASNVGTGVWVEVSGATLNLTPAMAEEPDNDPTAAKRDAKVESGKVVAPVTAHDKGGGDTKPEAATNAEVDRAPNAAKEKQERLAKEKEQQAKEHKHP